MVKQQTTEFTAFDIAESSGTANKFQFDNIRVLSDDLESSYTFAYNNANELTSLAGPNGTTSFTYDAWGRQVTQTLNSVTDSYAYRYGSKLYSVDLANDSVLDVVFDYGGDHKRRSTTEGAATTWYNWDAGWNVIGEEDGSGTLARTYFYHPQLLARATLAHVDGTNPATGAYNYYTHDHLGSTRALYDQSKGLVAEYSYTPYGQDYLGGNLTATRHRFSGHDWNSQAALYFAPFRYFSPQTARWVTEDPMVLLNSVNLYHYAPNPVLFFDSMGLWTLTFEGGWGVVGRIQISTRPDQVSVNVGFGFGAGANVSFDATPASLNRAVSCGGFGGQYGLWGTAQAAVAGTTASTIVTLGSEGMNMEGTHDVSLGIPRTPLSINARSTGRSFLPWQGRSIYGGDLLKPIPTAESTGRIGFFGGGGGLFGGVVDLRKDCECP